MKCELCNIDVPDIQFLNKHMSNVHKGIDRKNYYDKYLKQPKDGTCSVCGKSTKYINLVQGYQDICDKCKFDIAHTKTCVICGEPFVSRDSRTKTCKNPECRQTFGHNKYKNNTKTCICKMCGNTYQATDKQKKDMCKDCIKKTRNYTTDVTFEQIIGCRYCGKPITTEIKHYSSRAVKQLNCALCDECRQLNRDRVSQNMKLQNPMYTKEIRDRATATLKEHNAKKERPIKTKPIRKISQEEYDRKQAIKKYYQSEEYKAKKRQERHDKLSKRMKEHNPMYNKEVRDRASKTLKNRYADGTIKKHYGKDNWVYKGTRTIKGYLRLCLGDWIKSNLVRTDYTCEVCHKRGGTLHVHHKEQFAKIVDNGIKELNLDSDNLEFRSDDYQKLEQWVLNYHNTHDIGLVVCQKCHAEVDKRYFAPKKLYEN